MAPDRPAHTFVLGGGLTGLSCGVHLSDRPCTLVEREARVGGHAISHRRDGHTFDVTGHWLHLRDPEIRALVEGCFSPGDLVEIERDARVWCSGALMPYPFQANLGALAPALRDECLADFLRAADSATQVSSESENFRAFVERRFGAAMTRTFFAPYNRKLWGVDLDVLGTQWVQRFVPTPNAEQILAGARGEVQSGIGYNPRFVYPRRGGIDALPEALLRRYLHGGDGDEQPLSPGEGGWAADPTGVERARDWRVIRTRCTVEAIEPASQKIKLSDAAAWEPYAALVSTLPLPVLVAAIPSAPREVVDAAARLRCVPWRWLDIATHRPSPAAWHWLYVADEALPFFRVGIYSNTWPAMAPEGKSSLYVELDQREGPVDVGRVLAGLVTVGALASVDDVAFVEERVARWAYVLFDADWEPARAVVLDWLDSVGIISCGRYGAWTYNSMEDCIVEGRRAAARVRGGGPEGDGHSRGDVRAPGKARA